MTLFLRTQTGGTDGLVGAARGVLRQAEWAIDAPAFGSTFSPEKVEEKPFAAKKKWHTKW